MKKLLNEIIIGFKMVMVFLLFLFCTILVLVLSNPIAWIGIALLLIALKYIGQ